MYFVSAFTTKLVYGITMETFTRYGADTTNRTNILIDEKCSSRLVISNSCLSKRMKNSVPQESIHRRPACIVCSGVLETYTFACNAVSVCHA